MLRSSSPHRLVAVEPSRLTTTTAPDRSTYAKSHEQITDAMDALDSLERDLCLLERGRYVPNEAEHTRWMLDDLEEAVHGLRDLLATRSL